MFAKEGFSLEDRRVIESLKSVWGHGGHDLQLVLIGFGDVKTFPDSLPLGESNVWQSFTPFISTCHPKFYHDGRPKLDAEGWHIGSPAYDLRRLIIKSGLPTPTKIKPMSTVKIGTRLLRWLQFRTMRTYGNGTSSNEPPAGFRVTFPEKIRGPLAFGYGAHFRLGLFVPVKQPFPSNS